MRCSFCFAAALSLSLAGAARAQFEGEAVAASPGEARTSQWRIGMIVTASGGPCGAMTGTVTVPNEWPEQKVRVVGEDRSPGATIEYQTLEGDVRQMLVKIPRIGAGGHAQAVVTFEIARTAQRPPEKTDGYVLPDAKKLPRELRIFLAPSPYIESANPQIRALAKPIGAEKPTAWERVRAIYDWTRQKVQYRKDTPPKGTLQTLKDGFGDCDEMCSLFIALCRANGIPARTVRIPKHVYAEFYLEDAAGKGHWFPCQLAGDEEFGGISHRAPILQKGDNFKVQTLDPRTKRPKIETHRFIPDTLVGLPVPGGGQPQLKLIAEPVK